MSGETSQKATEATWEKGWWLRQGRESGWESEKWWARVLDIF